MAQFQVYRNLRASKRDVPFLLDLRSDFLNTPSRVVVPLIRQGRYGKPYGRLNPLFVIEGIAVVAVVAAVSDLAAIAASELRKPVANLSRHRDEPTAAIDFLMAGI